MKTEPKVLLTLNTAAGRLGLAPQTLKRRLVAMNAQADYAVLNGSRPLILCWDVDSLPKLRRALDLKEIVA